MKHTIKLKKFMFTLPEFYLAILAILVAYSPPFTFNPILIGIAIALMLQAIFKNKISGILIGILFFLVNLYFLVALLSEFNEFEIFGNEAKRLLFIGLSIWILNTTLSLLMVYKYAVVGIRTKTKLV